ncbi:MAG: GNAT family N-acetyltransferase [Gammaproteobacteria bacterium]
MAINYRRARSEDFAQAMEVICQSIDDLMQRHGFEGPATSLTPEFLAFSLEDDADGFWVAEDEGHVVGLGLSWVCGRFWFLADLFVLPEYQGRGIGGELMQLTFDHAQKNDAENRALITFAHNRSSIGLYAKHGLFPREPLYTVGAPSAALAGKVDKEVAWAGLDGNASQAAAIKRIDEDCLGFSRDKHHRYLLAEAAAEGVLFEDNSGPVGYAYVWSDGHVGPIAVASHAATGPVFNTTLALAMEQGAERISAFVSGANEEAMSVALGCGMRLDRTMVLVSAKSFGDWSKYMPNHPGFM